MSKNLYINVRVDELLKQKIDAAATKKNLSSADLIRQILEEQSEQILMGKKHQERDPILIDILDRITYIQTDLKYDTEGLKRPSVETYDQTLRKLSKTVTDQYRNE